MHCWKVRFSPWRCWDKIFRGNHAVTGGWALHTAALSCVAKIEFHLETRISIYNFIFSLIHPSYTEWHCREDIFPIRSDSDQSAILIFSHFLGSSFLSFCLWLSQVVTILVGVSFFWMNDCTRNGDKELLWLTANLRFQRSVWVGSLYSEPTGSAPTKGRLKTWIPVYKNKVSHQTIWKPNDTVSKS